MSSRGDHETRGGGFEKFLDQNRDFVKRLARERECQEALEREEDLRLGEDLERLRSAKPLRPETLGTLGDYRLLRQIGRGGMGVVYEAWQGSVERSVALKVLPAGIAADDRMFHRFMREAKTAAKLSHPHIVSVYAMGVDDHTPYYAMEYVEGETLAQISTSIKDGDESTETPFGEKAEQPFYLNVAKSFADVADGLQHAHSKGVVHRDIKPSNLILDGEAKLRILDFGLARLEGQESLTLSGDLTGTVLYMSPEQAMAKRIPLDHRTDVYSLGASLYEMLTGEPPFRGKDQQETLSQIIVRDPRSPRQLNHRVPKDLETIVLKCLRKDASDRYGTAEALGQDLRRFVRGDSVEARPESRSEKLIRLAGRNRTRLTAAVTVVALLGLCGALGYRLWQARENRLRRDYERQVVVAVMELSRAETVMSSRKLRGTDGERILAGQFDAATDEATLEDAAREAAREFLEDADVKLAARNEITPDRVEAHYYRARVLRLLGREDEAVASARRALEVEPEFPPALAFLEGGQHSAGRDDSRLERTSVSAWGDLWLRADEARRDKRIREAIEALTGIIELSETDREPFAGCHIQTLLERGDLLLSLREFAAAERDFWAARTLSRDYSEQALDPVLSLGRTYCFEGRPEEADTLFLQAFETEEDRAQAALWVSLTYESAGFSGAAARWLERAGDSVLARKLKTRLAFSLHDTTESLETARADAALKTSDVGAQLHLALNLLRSAWSEPTTLRKRIAELIGVAELVERIEPDGVEHHALWSQIWRLRGDHEQARQFEERVRAAAKAVTSGNRETGELPAPAGTRARATVGRELDGWFVNVELVSDFGINSPWTEWAPELSFDGRTLYFTSYRPGGGGGNADIWSARRNADGSWDEATPLVELNSSAWDSAPSVTEDAEELYFVSSRRGDMEIWVATRDPTTARLTSPRPLVEVSVEGASARAPEISTDGLELFFHVVSGPTRDLWVAWRDDRAKPFGALRPLDEINSECLEMQPSISRDGKVLFWGEYPGAPCDDLPHLWFATRSAARNAAGEPLPFEEPRSLPIFGTAPTIASSWPDAGAELYFVSCIPGLCGIGNSEIYRATWRPMGESSVKRSR